MAINRSTQTWPAGEAYEIPAESLTPRLDEVIRQMRITYHLPASWPHAEKDEL